MLGTWLIAGERRLVFIKSWLQMDRRRGPKGECERPMGTGPRGEQLPAGSPRGAPRCSGHQSNMLGGAALLGVPCVAISDSQPCRRADGRVPTPRVTKGRELQDATTVSGVWGLPLEPHAESRADGTCE